MSQYPTPTLYMTTTSKGQIHHTLTSRFLDAVTVACHRQGLRILKASVTSGTWKVRVQGDEHDLHLVIADAALAALGLDVANAGEHLAARLQSE